MEAAVHPLRTPLSRAQADLSHPQCQLGALPFDPYHLPAHSWGWTLQTHPPETLSFVLSSAQPHMVSFLSSAQLSLPAFLWPVTHHQAPAFPRQNHTCFPCPPSAPKRSPLPCTGSPYSQNSLGVTSPAMPLLFRFLQQMFPVEPKELTAERSEPQ